MLVLVSLKNGFLDDHSFKQTLDRVGYYGEMGAGREKQQLATGWASGQANAARLRTTSVKNSSLCFSKHFMNEYNNMAKIKCQLVRQIHLCSS